MTATVLLLKTQTRLLAWPLFALVAASVAIVCVPVDPLTGINCVVVILAMLLSGPVVFGAEYAEGARDYLDTRPVSRSRVFWVKVLLVSLTVVVGCEILALTVQPDYLASFTGFDPFGKVRSPELLMMAFVLSGTFWLSTITVLIRDLVRGLLYGMVTLPFSAGGLIVLAAWFFRAHFPPLISLPGSHFGYGEDPQAAVLQILLLLATPPLALGLLQSVYFTQAKRRFHIGRILPLAVLMLGSVLTLAHQCMKYDGKATLQGFGGFAGTAAANIQGDTLLYVPGDGDLKIKSINLKDSEQLKDSKWTEMTPLTSWNYNWDGIIKNRTVILFPGKPQQRDATRTVAFYRIGDASSLGEFKRYQGPFNAVARTDQSLEFYHPKRNSDNYSVDIESGEILDATELAAIEVPPGPLTTGDWVYRYDPEEHLIEIDRQREVMGAPVPSIRHDRIVAPAVDGEWLAGFGLDESPGYWTLAGDTPPGLTSKIRLLSAHYVNWANPPDDLEIPGSMYRWFNQTSDTLEWFGLNPVGKGEKPLIHLTLGGGYLCLWMSHNGIYLYRVALWDISDRNRVKYLGIFPGVGILSWFEQFTLGPFRSKGIQPPLVPIERDDGVLGFPVARNQILWLEIPGRIKGVKS